MTFVMEHNPSAWKIGWDMNLLAAAYSVTLISLIFFFLYNPIVKIGNLVYKVMDHLVDYYYLLSEINSMDLFHV